MFLISLVKKWYQRLFSDRNRIAIRRSIVRFVEFGRRNLAYRKQDFSNNINRNGIAAYYRNEVRQLEVLTGRYFHEWKDFY